MPSLSPLRQPELPSAWFATGHGRLVLECEQSLLASAGATRPGLPWVCISTADRPGNIDDRRLLWLRMDDSGLLGGDLGCAVDRWPLASESIGLVVVQHAAECGLVWEDALAEAARVLVPGGRIWLFSLNPLSPYRRHWWLRGMSDAEPFTWRRRLRRHGFEPDAVAEGIGPSWNPGRIDGMRTGAGARAAYRLRAEKRVIPLTGVRAPAPNPALTPA